MTFCFSRRAGVSQRVIISKVQSISNDEMIVLSLLSLNHSSKVRSVNKLSVKQIGADQLTNPLNKE